MTTQPPGTPPSDPLSVTSDPAAASPAAPSQAPPEPTAADGSSSGCLWFVATIVAFIAISIAAVVIFGDF